MAVGTWRTGVDEDWEDVGTGTGERATEGAAVAAEGVTGAGRTSGISFSN